MKNFFFFPGQGAQYPGMGIDLLEKSDSVRSLFDQASEASSLDLQKILKEGSSDDLKSTDIAQAAITLTSISASTVLAENGIRSEGCAGFSLGEYAALWEAGVVSVSDLFKMLKKRGELMEANSRKYDKPDGVPGMAAVIGMDFATVKKHIDHLADKGVYAANNTSPVQTVISGTSAGLAEATEALKEAGARRLIPLKVSGPFHTPLLMEAREEFEAFISNIEFKTPQKKLYSNVTGELVTDADRMKVLCGEQITSPVMWVKEEQSILDSGFDTFYEVGPGKVLTGLWKAFNSDFSCNEAGTFEMIISLSTSS